MEVYGRAWLSVVRFKRGVERLNLPGSATARRGMDGIGWVLVLVRWASARQCQIWYGKERAARPVRRATAR